MERIPLGITPRGTAQKAHEADGDRRLKLVSCNGHEDPSLHHKLVENRARHDRFAELGRLASVFSHEVANPLSGLSASLHFALKDLASLARDGFARKDLDTSIIQGTLQGALREVDRLVELLEEFRLAGRFSS